MADPMMMRKKSMNCCHVFKVDRLTVFKPASVIALAVRKKLSVKLMLPKGVADPHRIKPVSRDVKMK